MNTPPTNKNVLDWLDTLPPSLPLRAVPAGVTSADGKQLSGLIASIGMSSNSLVTALLWLRVGIIEPAHEIVQDGTAPLASYLHGVVHRLEGDYWNAKYWFRQVHDKRLLQSISTAMLERLEKEGLLDLAKNLNFAQSSAFSPAGFVTAHEQLCEQSHSGSEHATALERIAWIEWESLWKWMERA